MSNKDGFVLRLEDFLPYRLVVAASLVSQATARTYATKYTIGIAEWRVIATLGEFGTMTAKQIGAHSHMHKTKVSRAVATLTRKKMLARRANRDDKREAFLTLSPAGIEVYESIAPAALALSQRMFGEVSAEDRTAFERVLDTVTARAAALADTAVEVPE
jgi:DNA-binding MarR family transcriptional regulator